MGYTSKDLLHFDQRKVVSHNYLHLSPNPNEKTNISTEPKLLHKNCYGVYLVPENSDLINSTDGKSKKNLFLRLQTKLGFELWEILTAFTLALTLASTLMWFSNLQPRHLMREFAWLEQNKNKTYNLWLSVDNFEQNFVNNEELKNSDENCFKSVQKLYLNENLLKQKIEKLDTIETEISFVQQDFNQKVNNLQNTSGFSNILLSLKNYFDVSHATFDENFKLSKQLLTVQQQISMSCQDDFNKSTVSLENIEDLKLNLENINTSSSLEYKQNLDKFKNFVENLDKLPQKKRQIEIDKFKQSLNKIFVIDFQSLNNTRSLSVSKDKFLENLKNFEHWQNEYLSQNQHLKTAVVYIFDESKNG